MTKSKKGFTPLTASIAEGRMDVFKLIMEKGFKINWKETVSLDGQEGLYPIHLATLSGNPKMLEEIVYKDTSMVDLKTKDHLLTPLHLASKLCFPHLVEKLVQYGAKIDERDIKGNTPLMHAGHSQCSAVIAVLMIYGANPSLENQKGKRPKDILRRSSDKYLIKRALDKKNKRDIASEPLSLETIPKLIPPKGLKD